MDKYEYRVKTEQMMEYMEKRQYKKAMEIADTIDWRRVKNASMLNNVSEIYEQGGEFRKSRDILLVAFDRSPGSRKIVYRLGTLALRLDEIDEASDCYEEFVKIAPKDPNQYILKYKILKAQGSPLSEQIAALSDFKKAEYVEKWAYELAKLYHDAGMTAECLEECDDLILWFSEGKYVYQAMELKMRYKPLTPLQQEKYDAYKGTKRPGAVRAQAMSRPVPKPKTEPVKKTAPDATMEFTELPDAMSVDDILAGLEGEGAEPDSTRRLPTGELSDALAAMEAKNGDVSADEDEPRTDEEPAEEPEVKRSAVPVKPEVKKSTITTVVKGATLEEALANGVAMANGINREEKRKMEQREEELRISGQMKIEDILQEWEEKQKSNAEAIETQKAKDEKRLQKEREEMEARKEAQRREAERREAQEVEQHKKAAEEAARKAEEEAARKAEEEATRKAEEEAARKAEEEATRKAEEEAARKAEEEAARKAEEEAARKAAAKAKKEAEKKAAEEAKKAAEEEAAKKAAEEEEARKAAEEAAKKAAEEEAARKDAEVKKKRKTTSRKTKKAPVLSDDIQQLVDELEGRVAEEGNDDFKAGEGLELAQAGAPEEEYQLEFKFGTDGSFDDEPDDGSIFRDGFDVEDVFGEDDDADTAEELEEDDFDEAKELEEDDFDEAEELEEDDFDLDEEPDEDDFDADEALDEGDFDEEDDFEEDDFEEDDFEEDEELDEEDFDEDDFSDEEELEDEELDEEDFDEEDFDEDDFDEDDFDDFEDEELDEDDFDEDDFDEDDFEEDELEEDDFDEDDLDEDEFDGEDFFDDELPEIAKPDDNEPLEIEEPSEEEIQKRIKKSKGSGVPFDTGFVVTGRYDLSATSEIGLKAGLTEEQKKLFSYFVPVRGMSEQIVEVLDNDRRAQREGTSKTGNLLVIGRKGSGKTVLAVDIVKAIQKQRNLKQGKVAIVTGESLNKKELSNIIQKLRGGAIIVEKAGKLNSRTIKELSLLMEKKTGEMLFVLEDQRKPLERILTAHPDFKKKFTSRLELPVFINDELVTFGQTYAKENGYKLDEMGILALYSRIDVMQREDHAVTVAEVKEIMDEAIEHSQKANVKHLARRMFGRSTDESDRIILKEEDFKN